MGRRTLLLIAAVLLAAIGTSVLFLYVNSISGDPRPSGQTGTALAPTVTIGAGVRIPEGVQLVPVPVADEATGFVTDPSQIVGRVANRELLAYQPLSQSQFGGPVTTRTTVELAEGQMAVTVEVEDAGRLANLLRPGNDVAVWVVDPQTGDRTDQEHQARLILEKVKIITIGSQSTIQQNADPEGAGGETGSAALVTLQVSQEEAAEIMVASVAGEIRFTLLGDKTEPRQQTYGDEVLRTNP